MNKKILIVEDEVGFAEFLRALLESRGYKVTTASNGDDALKKLKSGDPDLMILDMQMPGMGGIQVYTKICTRHGRSRFPVIVNTAMTELSGFFNDVMVDVFVTKPVNADRLLKHVERLLSGEDDPKVVLIDREGRESSEITACFESERFQVRRVEDVKMLEAVCREPKADIVLINDLIAGSMSPDWVSRIRTCLGNGTLAVIVYSVIENAELRKRFLSEGADFYLGRFNDFQTLFIKVNEILKSKKSQVH
jgi:DNA-binding response OmpR family regulator